MKGIKAILWSVLLGASGPTFSSDTGREDSVDYATGMVLATTESSPWYRVALPQAVYEQTAWPDLRDVRVFNRQGDTLPFAMVAQTVPPVAPDTVSLRLFPLTMSPVASPEAGRARGESLVLRSKSGMEIHLQSDDMIASGQSYLLMLPDNMTNDFSLEQLRLNWTTPEESWQGKASLYYSWDLRYWRPLMHGAPLMDLRGDGERLKMDAINISGRLSLSPEENRYLLLVLDSQSPALTLNSVSAVAQNRKAESQHIMLPGSADKATDNEIIWRWTQAQPLTSLRITLANEGVLPVELSWRSSEKAPWQPLTKTVLYQLNGKLSDEIPLAGHLVEAVRMVPINARLPEILPVVTGTRDSYQLVFNTQGAGPYMLAWGNRAAQKADISMDMLIPASLRQTQVLPWAVAQERVTLGGEARLTALSVADRQSRWITFLVWGALILGVVALSLMAWRIWREVKKGTAA
ncbi:MAG TPA: DUF3999 domain-containing protein [Klebsiella sp.]